MQEHIDNVIIPDIINTYKDQMVAGNSFIDFKDYKPHIEYIYGKLKENGITSDMVALKADFMGLSVEYFRIKGSD